MHGLDRFDEGWRLTRGQKPSPRPAPAIAENDDRKQQPLVAVLQETAGLLGAARVDAVPFLLRYGVFFFVLARRVYLCKKLSMLLQLYSGYRADWRLESCSTRRRREYGAGEAVRDGSIRVCITQKLRQSSQCFCAALEPYRPLAQPRERAAAARRPEAHEACKTGGWIALGISGDTHNG